MPGSRKRAASHFLSAIRVPLVARGEGTSNAVQTLNHTRALLFLEN